MDSVTLSRPDSLVFFLKCLQSHLHVRKIKKTKPQWINIRHLFKD